jgi:hypothetical protein
MLGMLTTACITPMCADSRSNEKATSGAMVDCAYKKRSAHRERVFEEVHGQARRLPVLAEEDEQRPVQRDREHTRLWKFPHERGVFSLSKRLGQLIGLRWTVVF